MKIHTGAAKTLRKPPQNPAKTAKTPRKPTRRELRLAKELYRPNDG